MFSHVLTLVALLSSVCAQFSISTPASLVERQPAAISWTGGTGPFILDVIPGGQVQAAPIEEISASLPGTSTTWTVNVAAGQYITLKLTDSTGSITYSSPDTIQAGSNSACLNSTATSALAAAGTSSAVTSSMMSSAVSSGTGTGIVGGPASSAHPMSAVASSSMTSAVTTTPSTSATSGSSVAPTTSATSATPATSTNASKASSATVAASSAARPSSSGGAMATADVQLPALALAALGGVFAFL